MPNASCLSYFKKNMIVVLADDLSGAVEMAGIGWRYGISSEIRVNSISETDKDLVVIDTDTRSVDVKDAERILCDVVNNVSKFKTDWIYKKTDSILRGHVVAELLICKEYFNIEQILLVPENPSAGRTVNNGLYYIDGVLLEQTEFSRDPEYPRLTSDIKKMLTEIRAKDIHFVSAQTPPKGPGLFFGVANDSKNITGLARFVNDTMLPAGGSEFFSMILKEKGHQIRKHDLYDYHPGRMRLFVSGSASEQSRQDRRRLNKSQISLCPAPKDLAENDHSIRVWTDTIVSAFNSTEQVAAYISQPVVTDRNIARQLLNRTARCISKVISSLQIDELIIEGGATASAIIRKMKWDKLIPLYEFETGVVALEISDHPGINLIIKPGSYPMPQLIWQG
jgi:uncharacterized protein YgbK (DUF1537 family)